MIRPQFSLRSLLIITVTLGVAIGTHSWWLRQLRSVGTLLTPVEKRPIAWYDYSPELLAQAKGSGRPVLLNFDADWDLVTVVNRERAFETPTVRRLIADHDVIPIHIDCTHQDERRWAELNNYGRSVPLTVIHSPATPDFPVVLHGLQSEQSIATALRKTTKGPPRRTPWDVFQSPLVGAIGMLLLIGLSHLLARTESRQAAGLSESSASSLGSSEMS